MDLFCLQGEALTGKYLDWADEKFNEPAGTHGLKPAEVCMNYFIIYEPSMYTYIVGLSDSIDIAIYRDS